MTTARRFSCSLSDVRSVDRRSGSIGNITPGVYTDVVFCSAWRSTAECLATAAPTSAMATITLTWPFFNGSATDSWSRSRESSLSIEHHNNSVRSRVGSSVVRGASFNAAASASAAGGMVGSRPRSRMARTAMARSRARSESSVMSKSYLVNGRRHVLDERVDLRLMRAKAQHAHAAEEAPVCGAAGYHHPPAPGGLLHQRARGLVFVGRCRARPREVKGEQRQIRRRVDD